MPGLTLAQRTARRRRRYGRVRGPGVGGTPRTITSPLTIVSRAWIAPGADLTQPHTSWVWEDITEFVRWDDGINITYFRRENSDKIDTCHAALKLDNRDRRFTRKNVFGPYFPQLDRSTPILLALDPGDGFHERFHGFVNEWPRRWDTSGNDGYVPIVCRGTLHRLTRDQRHRSPLYYSVSGLSDTDGSRFVPHVYVPLEDGPLSTQFASGLVGGAAVSPTGTVAYATDDGLPGSDPLPTFAADAGLTVPVPTYSDPGHWQAQTLVYLPPTLSAASGLTVLTVQYNSPSIKTLVVSLSPATDEISVSRYDPGGTLIGTNTNTISSDFPGYLTGNWFWLTLALERDKTGSDDQFSLRLWTLERDNFGSLTDPIGTTSYGAVTAIGINGALAPTPAGAADAAYGHVALWTDPDFDVQLGARDYLSAANAFDGELAHLRVQRVCRERRIPLRCMATTSTPLGPQQRGTTLEILQRTADADLGYLFEFEFGLAYAPPAERDNQPITLTLDLAAGQIADDLNPEDSDRRFRNQWTARRSGGSSATVQARDGYANIQLPDSATIYEDEGTFNVEIDERLPDVAGWHARRDSIDVDWWTDIGINLAHHPELIESWLVMTFSSRFVIDGMIDKAGVDRVDLLMEGYRERWNSKEWTASLYASPAAIHTIGVLDDTDFRVDSGSSTLTADVAVAALSFQVTTSNPGDLWTTAAADFPLEVEISGIPITIASISGASSPQTFDVEPTGNQVSKILPAGTETHVRYSLVLGL